MSTSLQEQTQQGLRQIQQNARTLKKWDNKLQNWDEVSQSIERRIQEQFGAIPAEFGAQTSPTDFDDPLSTELAQFHQQKVTDTKVFEAEIIASVKTNDAQNRNWLQSFKQALSSESLQNQLQKFKNKKSIQLTDAQQRERVQFINKLNAQIQKLKPGQRIGDWTVRTHQGEKFLDKRNGDEISRATLPTQSSQTLEKVKRDIHSALSQEQTTQFMPLFANILKSQNTLSFQSKNTSIRFNPDDKTLTFTKGNETLVARSQGKNQWEYVSGSLSEATVHNLTTTVVPQVEKRLKQLQQEPKNRNTLAS